MFSLNERLYGRTGRPMPKKSSAPLKAVDDEPVRVKDGKNAVRQLVEDLDACEEQIQTLTDCARLNGLLEVEKAAKDQAVAEADKCRALVDAIDGKLKKALVDCAKSIGDLQIEKAARGMLEKRVAELTNELGAERKKPAAVQSKAEKVNVAEIVAAVRQAMPASPVAAATPAGKEITATVVERDANGDARTWVIKR